MKNKKLFQKIVLIALAVAVLLALVAPAIFSQTPTTPKQEKLLNGLKVLLWPDAKADKVYVKVRIHAGSAFDPQGREGVMQLLADNIFPNQVSREFFADDLGGNLEVIVNYDFIQINASSTPEHFLTMLETVATAVSSPTIDKETTIKLRNALLARVGASEGDPAYIADQAVAKRLFGTFPYGRPQFGTAASLQKIDFADLFDARNRFLTADNATVAVSGNFERTLGFRAVRRYFGGWLKSDKRVPATFRQPDEPPVGVQMIASPKPDVTAVRFAVRGVARSEKDFAAARLFSLILEDRLKTRVPASRAAEVFVRSDERVLPGIVVIGFPPDSESFSDGKTPAGVTIERTMASAVTEAEFAAAKGRFVTEWGRKDRVSFWLDADTFGIQNVDLDAKAAENVTLAVVNAYAEKLRRSSIVGVRVAPSPPAG